MIKYLYGKLLKKVTRGHHLSNKCSHVLWMRMLGTRNDKNRKRKAHLFHTKMRCSAEHKSLNTHAAIFYIVDNDIGFCLAHEGHVTFAPRLSCKDNIVRPLWDHSLQLLQMAKLSLNQMKRNLLITNHLKSIM